MDDAWATVEALAADAGSGAAEIAREAAGALTAIQESEIQSAIETLLRGHPEMAPLWRLGADVLGAVDSSAGVRTFRERLQRDRRAVHVAAPALPDRLLTISYSSMVTEVVRVRRPASVVCMASEPGGEGVRMAAALSASTEAIVIDDEEAIASCPADAVVVGADAITPTSLVNKVKTGRIAESAGEHGIVCFGIAGETKLVPVELPFGSPFEAMALDLFSGIATPAGLLSPPDASKQAASVGLHPLLLRLAESMGRAGSLAEDRVP